MSPLQQQRHRVDQHVKPRSACESMPPPRGTGASVAIHCISPTRSSAVRLWSAHTAAPALERIEISSEWFPSELTSAAAQPPRTAIP